MTSDKFIYLFGRIIPALSLVLSMTLRFIPKFRAQFHVVSQAQRCIGRDTTQGSVLQRVRNGVTIFSIMLTWSLENAIETADSMKSRGYGLPGRTAFSIYRFDDRDRLALVWLGFCGVFLISGWVAGGLSMALLSHHSGRGGDAHDHQLLPDLSGVVSDAGDGEQRGGQSMETYAIRDLSFTLYCWKNSEGITAFI